MRDLGLEKVQDLLDIVKDGQINKAYTDLSDWFCDFWPDLSWNEEGRKKDINTILNHPKFNSIQVFFLGKYAANLEKRLRKAL